MLSGLAGIHLNSGERRLAFVIIQVLFFLPLLAVEYCYLAGNMNTDAVQLLLFSEIIFALLWFSLALRLQSATKTPLYKSPFRFLVEIANSALIAVAACYFIDYHAIEILSDSSLILKIYGAAYFVSVFLLASVVYTAWRMEQFWRYLNAKLRWEYKCLVAGTYLICGVMAWSASFRLTYLTLYSRHLLLLSAIICLGWLLIVYAVFRHRLLNRKVFVSRKVLYSFFVPSVIAGYLLCFGVISLIMRTFGLEMSFVLQWLLLITGFVVTGLFATSGKIRRNLHFFISTNFYVNKYEYRDEWLALTNNLRGAESEADVVNALREVLSESLYTTEFYIWTGNPVKGYKLAPFPGTEKAGTSQYIAARDPLVNYIKTHSRFHLNEKDPDTAWKEIVKIKRVFLDSLNLMLITPVSIGDQLTGLIGLGPEYTGGQYSYDDFDLLSVLGSQTASALLAVRMTEELAHAREQQAWNKLSTFVLHDIKNAATMLSMLQTNAPAHIHKPEFQDDMLELVDDTIKRMNRVEQRLTTLKDEIIPTFKIVQLSDFLKECSSSISARLTSMTITIQCEDSIKVNSDPALLFSIMENLLLNAYEEKNDAVVQINVNDGENNEWAIVELLDNGPGIAEDLLPVSLFEPFKTTKESGSGIGLWQVKNVISSIGGNITAENRADTGARFILELPK